MQSKLLIVLCVAAAALAAPQYNSNRGTLARRRNRYQSPAPANSGSRQYTQAPSDVQPTEAAPVTEAPSSTETVSQQYTPRAQLPAPSPAPSASPAVYSQRAQLPAPAPAPSASPSVYGQSSSPSAYNQRGSVAAASTVGRVSQPFNSGSQQQYNNNGAQQYNNGGAQQYNNVAQQGQQGQRSPPVPIVRYQNQPTGDGGNQHAYETGNGIEREEGVFIKELTVTDEYGKQKTVKVPVYRGSFKYQQPDGTFIEVQYEADETGFHAVGDSIPQALQ